MKLNKNKIYDLSELTIDELYNVWNYLRQNNKSWEDYPFTEMIIYQKTHFLCFNSRNWRCDDTIKPTANAKELFYTLENIQVDCTNLTEEQVKEMADVFEKNGFDVDLDGITDEHFYLRLAKCGDSVDLFRLDDTKTTITYDKFMELFGENEKLPPYKEVPLKWNYQTLVGGNQVVIEHTKEFIPSKKQVLKYLLNRGIILTPKQYKKLWKKS